MQFSAKLAPKTKKSVTLEPKSKKVTLFWGKLQGTLINLYCAGLLIFDFQVADPVDYSFIRFRHFLLLPIIDTVLGRFKVEKNPTV